MRRDPWKQRKQDTVTQPRYYCHYSAKNKLQLKVKWESTTIKRLKALQEEKVKDIRALPKREDDFETLRQARLNSSFQLP